MTDSDAAELLYDLESSGHRLTRLCQSVIEIFSHCSQPLLLEELVSLLRKRAIEVHRATLYRELDFLEKKQFIVPVTLNDKKLRYEFADRNHHHHAVCLQCRKIEEIEVVDDEVYLKKMVKSSNNFEITRHALEFFGICGKCKSV